MCGVVWCECLRSSSELIPQVTTHVGFEWDKITLPKHFEKVPLVV